jgi:predicted transcriptional regulator
MKVNIKAVMGAKSHVDTVDLYSAKLRSGLVNQCCILFEEDREVILDELSQLVNKLEEVRTEYRAKHGQPEAPEVHISKEDRKQALKILESEDLLKMIGEDLERTGIAGEEINRRMMYMVFTSRKLANPISVTVKGDSSGGKSYLINQTLKLFPEEDVKNFTEISAKSLFYMPEDALEHKILVIFERHGSESSDYSIRSLQSENKLKIAVASRDPLTNEIKTTERIVRGPVCFVETTTALNIHPENETRCFDLYVDESEKQTEKIFFNQNLSYQPSNRLKPEEQEGILRKHKTIQRLLKPVRVTIDYVDKIKFPKHELRFRRDRVKFLSLIECFAFIYQYQRERVVINGEEYVKATLEDYRMAYELAAKIMTDTLSPLHQKSRELLDHIVAILTVKSKTSFSVGDIAEKTGWKSLRIRRYLKQLEEEEYVERKNPGPGVRALFILCRSGPRQDILSGLLSPQDLKRLVS